MNEQHPYYAVWAAPIGAVAGLAIAYLLGVEKVPSESPQVAVGLLLAIVFSGASWGNSLFLPGFSRGETRPTTSALMVSVVLNIPLMLLWAILPVLSLALRGDECQVSIDVVFAGLGSASVFALTAGMAEGIRRRLQVSQGGDGGGT